MTIDECIEALQAIKKEHPDEGGGIEVAVGIGFGEGGKIESVSLQAEPSGGENEVVFEENFGGEQPETQLSEKIKGLLRRYYEVDPWTEEPNKEFDEYCTAQDTVDNIVDLL